MVLARNTSLIAVAMLAGLLVGCVNVGLVDPDTQRAIEEAQRESMMWQKMGVPDRAADANARAHQLQQRVDSREIGFTEFIFSVVLDAWLGSGHEATKKQ